VDANMMTAERNAILAVINASVLSAYFLCDFPSDDRRGDPLAEEKYEPFVHYHQEHMGLDFKKRNDGPSKVQIYFCVQSAKS
jgi:hypothetical protein